MSKSLVMMHLLHSVHLPQFKVEQVGMSFMSFSVPELFRDKKKCQNLPELSRPDSNAMLMAKLPILLI